MYDERGYIHELFVSKPERARYEGFWHQQQVNITLYQKLFMMWAVYKTGGFSPK